MRRFNRNDKGVTLIMVAGVLSILAAMGAGFYTLTISQSKSAVRYSDSVRADMMARAGMSDAIARLQEQAFYKTEDPTDGWYQTDWLHAARRHVSFPAKNTSSNTNGTSPVEQFASYSRSLSNSAGTTSDRYSLDIADTSGRINVNAGDNLGVLLDNLCRVIGPPLVAANLDALQPARWAQEGAPALLYKTAQNKDDTSGHLDLYSRLDGSNHQLAGPDGNALYGDGYAIAGYRGRNGKFARLEDVRLAVSTVYHPNHPELEELERSVKFNALREYITIDSWVDTNTVCVGKFEWADLYRVIDRDKSWIASVDIKGKDIEDGQNTRGSLVGCYLSIINGHGAGQLRRIKMNGIDWLELDEPFAIIPGPTSSYMIISREDGLLEATGGKAGIYPKIDLKGTIALTKEGHLQDDPNIDYKHNPLCIHRAPVNINTASDKVLIAMFMGINVQHGTPLAIGTDADERKITDLQSPKAWFQVDLLKLFRNLPTQNGLKRIPLDSGKPMLNCKAPWTDSANFGYINNYSSLTPPSYLAGGGVCTEAHQLAYRVIMARQATLDPKTQLPKVNDYDPNVPLPYKAPRGPFKSWDDFFFRVVQPWDNDRIDHGPKDSLGNPVRLSLAPMIMAHFNSNTDLLKFNPNIEWIDRWGRNFTSMEPVITGKGFNGKGPLMTGVPEIAQGLSVGPIPAGSQDKPDPKPDPKKTTGTYPIDNHKFYYIRNVRYRFDEMIDKSDLNRSTTEFTMDAGGVYEIHSIGQVVVGGEIRAERKLEALVQVYDVWRESTQRQFVEGHFSEAARKNTNGTNKTGLTDAGKITRDADSQLVNGVITHDSYNLKVYKSLDTLPEPLMPLKFRFMQPNNWGGGMKECVDDKPKDCIGNPKKAWSGIGGGSDYEIPDVIANKVLPAGFDGQLVLAANTLVFDPATSASNSKVAINGPGGHDDTFLASFDGDLDTDSCLGNGREQAKTPLNCSYRVCDTISLLGILNDNEIDIDSDSVEDIIIPGGPPLVSSIVNGKKLKVKAQKVNPIFLLNLNAAYASESLNAFPKNTDAMRYEYCMSCRVGDLRADGVYLGALGVSCKDATLKYAFGGGDVGGGDSHAVALGSNQLLADGLYQPKLGEKLGSHAERGGGSVNGKPGYTGTPFMKPFTLNGKGGYNYQPGNNNGCTISMWVKTTWNATDNQEHEFFNGSSNGSASAARYNKLCKQGYVSRVLDPATTIPATIPLYPPIYDGTGFLNSTLFAGIEDRFDNGAFVGIHGGLANVDEKNQVVKSPVNLQAETPSYYVQPFRWTYVGQVHKMGGTAPTKPTPEPAGALMSGQASFQMGYVVGPVTDGLIDFDLFYEWIYQRDGAIYIGMKFFEDFGFWDDNLGYSPDGVAAPNRGDAQKGVDSYAKNIIRPFISTARNPEGTKFKTDYMMVSNTLYPYYYRAYIDIATGGHPGNQYNARVDQLQAGTTKGPATGKAWLGQEKDNEPQGGAGWNYNTDLVGQPAAYRWAQHNAAQDRSFMGCFSLNNTNQGYAPFFVPPPPPPPPPRAPGPPYPFLPPGPGPQRPPPPPPPIPRPPRPH